MIIAARGEEKIRDRPINQSNYTTKITRHHHIQHNGQSHWENMYTQPHVHAHTQGITGSPSCWGSGIKGLRGAYSIPHPVPPKITPRARMVPATAPISLFVATLTVQRK